jgi:hypothetical protein
MIIFSMPRGCWQIIVGKSATVEALETPTQWYGGNNNWRTPKKESIELIGQARL